LILNREKLLERDCMDDIALVSFPDAMANAINIPKSHLIMGLSLPLAVLLGYFVAEPMELGSLAVVVFVMVALSIPLILKWYYPLLVLGWNAVMAAGFLPGRPYFWALLAFVGLLIAVVSRAVSPNARFVIEPSITKSLLAMTGVVIVTGLLTGGIGSHLLGSDRYGGRNYFYFFASVAGYFVFTSRLIPPHRAGLYVAMYWLAGLTGTVGVLAALGGSKLDFLWLFFPPVDALQAATLEGPLSGPEPLLRIMDFSMAGAGLYGYLLARFGIRGVLDLTQPWRLLLFLLALVGGLLSGFRSFVLLSSILFAILFYLEGLHRTRYALALVGGLLLTGVVVLPQAAKLPLAVQRALSFLPGQFDYTARADALASTEWRVEMWRQALPEVPKYLFRGRGWSIDARDFFTTVEIGHVGDGHTATVLTGNFHNGPLSILIPFGLYGLIAFVWFLFAGLRVLNRNWKFGSPALQNVNALLLATFAARAVFFFAFYGCFQLDLAAFTGLLGLGIALNGAGPLVPAEQSSAGVELNTEYIKA
jgi:hypothetical protein